MKKISSMIVLIGMVLMISSCSKNLVLSDGSNSKLIKIASKVKITTDENQVNYANFTSALGTKYHIDMTKYTLTLENQVLNTSAVSYEPEK